MPSIRFYKGPEHHTKLRMIPALLFMLPLLFFPASVSAETEENTVRTVSPAGLRQLTAFPGRCAIGFYKFFISEQDLPTCNFEPTCSMFSLRAYKATDPLQATFMMFDRLTRCNYWIYGEYPHEHGRFVDPVAHHMLWGLDSTTIMHRHPGISVSSMKPNGGVVNHATDTPYMDMAFADAMAGAGETELALDEYSRLSGDTFPQDIRIKALFHGGWTLFESERFADAAATYDDIQSLAGINSVEAGDASLLKHLALSGNVHSGEATKLVSDLMNYINMWDEIQKRNFTEARHLLKNLENSPEKKIALACSTLTAAMDSLDKPLNKRGWIAGSFSALVPGLGRIYTGRYGDAVFSSVATGGTIGLVLRALKTGPWTKGAFFTGAAAGFYVGNIYGSIVSARTENARSRKTLASVLYTYAKSHGLLPRHIITQHLASRLPASDQSGKNCYDETLSAGALEEANGYYYERQWHISVRSFRRHIFFTPKSAIKDSVLFRLGKTLEHTGEREKACNMYEELLDKYPGSVFEEETRLILARNHFRNGDSELASLELDEEMEYGNGRTFVEEASYLKTWVFIHNFDFEGARAWRGKQRGLDSEKIITANSIVFSKLNEQRYVNYKSPRIARGLSAVVPGLGQAYAGKPLNGAGALLINGAIIYSMVHSVQSENWLDLGLIAGLLFHRFYLGNIYNAERFCLDYNNEQNTRIIKSLRNDVRTIGITFDPYFIRKAGE